MSQSLNDCALVFSGAAEEGFELETNPGVWVRPLLRTSEGARVDVFHMTLAGGAEVSPEAHPYSETLIVIDGELSCGIEDHPPVVIGAGEAIHIAPHRRHHVVNTATGRAETAMLIGV